MDCIYWEISIREPEGFIQFLEKSVSFLHVYFGDVREAVAHSDQISKFGRVIYNQASWDTEKFADLKDEIVCANHYDVVKELILRIQKYKSKKLDLGFVGRWKNPYQIADTHLPTGITMTYELKDDLIQIQGAFFKPDHWFDLQCKPMFKTDALVAKEPNGSWNMNQVGLIASKPERCAANRRALFNMLTAFLKEYTPMFMSLSKCKVYYNAVSNSAYLEDPAAKDNEALLPMIYAFQKPGKILHSDSSEITFEEMKQITVQDFFVFYDHKHFDL